MRWADNLYTTEKTKSNAGKKIKNNAFKLAKDAYTNSPIKKSAVHSIKISYLLLLEIVFLMFRSCV